MKDFQLSAADVASGTKYQQNNYVWTDHSLYRWWLASGIRPLSIILFSFLSSIILSTFQRVYLQYSENIEHSGHRPQSHIKLDGFLVFSHSRLLQTLSTALRWGQMYPRFSVLRALDLWDSKWPLISEVFAWNTHRFLQRQSIHDCDWIGEIIHDNFMALDIQEIVHLPI